MQNSQLKQKVMWTDLDSDDEDINQDSIQNINMSIEIKVETVIQPVICQQITKNIQTVNDNKEQRYMKKIYKKQEYKKEKYQKDLNNKEKKNQPKRDNSKDKLQFSKTKTVNLFEVLENED